MIPNLAKPFQKSASPDANRQLLFIPGIISVLKCEQDIWISQIPLLFPNALIFIPFPTYPLSLFFYFVSMPDWKLPDEIQKDGDVFIKLIHSLAGIYMCVFLSLFLFILLIYPQVRVVHLPRLWMGFYLREEEVPLAHGQHCRCPQLNVVTSEYRYFILRTDIYCC